MKNRAKCRLCNSIIESFHAQDMVECTCGEIAVFGGPSLECAAKNWDNFRRVDDKGNEIVPKIDDVKQLDITPKSRKEELLDGLQGLIEGYERLPPYAMSEPVSNADLLGVLLLIKQLHLSD